jgi:hypothetical protein
VEGQWSVGEVVKKLKLEVLELEVLELGKTVTWGRFIVAWCDINSNANHSQYVIEKLTKFKVTDEFTEQNSRFWARIWVVKPGRSGLAEPPGQTAQASK